MEKLRMDRRRFLNLMGQGALGLASSSSLVAFLTGCSRAELKESSEKSPAPPAMGTSFPFKPLPASAADKFETIPEFSHEVLIKADESINRNGDLFGWNCDYTAFLPAKGESDEGFLLVNHEFPSALLQYGYEGKAEKTRAQFKQEMLSVGNSILRIRRSKKNQGRTWEIVKNSPFNRRIHGLTPIPFANSQKVKNAYTAIGTLANCAGGVTPWQTFLTCEENYEDFYGDRKFGEKEVDYEKVVHGWPTYAERPPEHYGWVVEINPYTAKAKKLTALGRFGHECATINLGKDGRAVAYMGDDVAGGCVYKFIAKRERSLDEGTLYVADFAKGRWLPLDLNQSPELRKHFVTQMDVLVYARQAAKILGGTPMDRPEDFEIQPGTNNIILALTNNKKRGNLFGSLFKIIEKNDDPMSLECSSETFLAGGPEAGFACPDNLVFDQKGNLWFTSDIANEALNQGEYSSFGNNSLFYVPVQGDKAGRAIRVISAPVDAELTGPTFSPDYRTLFLSVQHPGYNSPSAKELTSHWPDGGDSKPRSSVVQVFGEGLERLAKA